MRPLLLAASTLAVALIVAVLVFTSRSSPPLPHAVTAVSENEHGDMDMLRQDVAALTRRLEALERSRALETSPARAVAAPVAAETPSLETSVRNPQWYLDRYVESFADGTGSELYRLYVDALVVELVEPICSLVRDVSRPVPLRLALVTMLGRTRFGTHTGVTETLVEAARDEERQALVFGALDALSRIGNEGALRALESLALRLAGRETRARALDLLVQLAGEGSNGRLLTVFTRASDTELRTQILKRVDDADLDPALEMIRRAAGMEVAVRLTAALKLVQFPYEEFRAFAAEWAQFETDPEILAVLRRAVVIPAWHAMNAIGAPDAPNPKADSAKAWAYERTGMGQVWLELSYSMPMRANGVRIFEALASGAVAEIRARAPDGSWKLLWSGSATSELGRPLALAWPDTSFDVSTIRVVLDTHRAKNWNEIDAVELVGSWGSQWASRARASSNYGAGQESARAGAASVSDQRKPR